MKKHAHSGQSLMQAISMGKSFKHKPLLWGAHTLAWPQQKHSKLCASLITIYPICMNVQTDAMKPHQPYPWTIGPMQFAIANVVPTLWPSFLQPSDINSSESYLSIHHKLPHRQHSLQHHSEGESLPPLCTLVVLLQAKEWRHPEESTVVSKCKHTKEDGQQTNAGQYPLFALLVHIEDQTNIQLIGSKHSTFVWMLEEMCSLNWQNT